MTTKIEKICLAARLASYELSELSASGKNAALFSLADRLEESSAAILSANKVDLDNYSKRDTAFLDRLTLTKKRIFDMADGVRQVAKLPDPIGEVVESWVAPSGLEIQKVRVPLGVVGVIYEARPNVTADVSALCFKSGNAVVLRGGSDALNSNRAVYKVIKDVLGDAVQFIDDADRSSTSELLKQDKYIDVVIPRGGDGLKNFVLENAKMPVIASAGGNCHVYVDRDADLEKATKIVLNAKLSRPSVCNALEHLLVHASVADKFLPEILKKLKDAGVIILGCPRTNEIFACDGIATETDYKTEFEALKISVKVVETAREAISRINANSTKHSEAIVTENKETADLFTRVVDSGAVYVNASTRFTDGYEFGFGAEIGISTQKIHARGPLGLRELTSIKYVCTGDGMVRE